MANEVKEGLKTVHRLLLAVAGTAGVGLWVCFPRLSDARQAEALDKLQALSGVLDPAATEAALERQAEAGAVTNLQAVVAATEGRGVPKLETGDARSTVFRAQPVSIETLGDIVDASAGGRPLQVVGPDIKQLGTSLRWRLARRGGDEGLQLTDLRLAPAGATEQQLAREQRVEALRLRALDTREARERARARFEYFRERTKALWKRKAPRKVQWKMHEKRREARAELKAAAEAQEHALAAYEQAAQAAQGSEPAAGGDRTAGVVVVASLARASEGPLELRIPVPKVHQTLTSVPIPEPALSALEHDPLWPELSKQTPEAAQAGLKRGLSWHLWGTRLGGLRVGGVTVVQLFPALLLALLGWLSHAAHRVREAYSPFNHPGSHLPEVGTGHTTLDAMLLIVPVLVVVALSVWTLLRIDAQWWIALLFGAAAVGYSVVVFRSVEELKELRSNILRTSLPPAPSTGQENQGPNTTMA